MNIKKKKKYLVDEDTVKRLEDVQMMLAGSMMGPGVEEMAFFELDEIIEKIRSETSADERTSMLKEAQYATAWIYGIIKVICR